MAPQSVLDARWPPQPQAWAAMLLTYGRLMGPLVRRWSAVTEDLPRTRCHCCPLPLCLYLVRNPGPAAGHSPGAALVSQQALARALFAASPPTRFCRSNGRLACVRPRPGHGRARSGWPIAQGGSQAIADTLAAYLRDLGGRIGASGPSRVRRPAAGQRLPLRRQSYRQPGHMRGRAPALCVPAQAGALSPRPGRIQARLGAGWPDPLAYGPNAGPPAPCTLGGTLAEMARSEQAAWHGSHPEQPYLILTQPSLFDPDPRTGGKRTAWAYCHVLTCTARTTPCHNMRWSNASRPRWAFAPGEARILARHVMARRTSRPTTPTTWAAMYWRRAGTLYRSSSPGRSSAATHTPPLQRHLPVFGLHPARRRRPWHVRLSAARSP